MTDTSIDIRALALNVANSQCLQFASSSSKGVEISEMLSRAKAYEEYLNGDNIENTNENNLVELAARTVHEVNRLIQKTNNEKIVSLSWEKAPKDQKNSILIGVQKVLDDPNVTEEELHNSWLKTKTEQGWKYGRERDDELKLHPCMIPYIELPVNQKLKDAMFRTIVKAIFGI